MAWGAMRMSPTDIADVTAATYTYLLNGVDPLGNWTGVFEPGERVRLRIINASSMTFFNVRIPGLPMTVVAADGPAVAPVEVDELQIGVAETYDVVVAPEDRAYTIMAESIDRSGHARGTLAPRAGMSAPVPALREPPRRTMIDMGMDHGDAHAGHPATPSAPDDPHAAHHGMHHDEPATPAPLLVRHGPDTHGPGNASVAEVQRNRLAEPGVGLENVGHRVLTYADLRSPTPRPDAGRPADRDLELHLTGNMERYMWSFDGVKFSEVAGPIVFEYGERIRLILVNDTMMEHPIHLHGMFMELENGAGDHRPLKHTLAVKPSERVSLLVDATEPGRWAFHCHLLYHMEMGMMRVVRVNGGPERAV
jgi:CopA family copper-resistance protein